MHHGDHLQKRSWTQDEIAFLTHNYGHLSATLIGQRLGRSRTSVLGQAQHLKIKVADARFVAIGLRPPKWSQPEINLLREMYPQSQKQDVLDRLGEMGRKVAWSTIVAMASEIGLRRVRDGKLVRLPKITLTDVEKTWLACALDGEGEIGIGRSMQYRGKPYRYSAFLGLTNTHRGFIEYAYHLCGATTKIQQQKLYGTQHKIVWRFRIQDAARVFVLLQSLRPYFIIKGEQCKIALAFLETWEKLTKGYEKHQTLNYSCEMENYYQAMRKLNKRGVHYT